MTKDSDALVACPFCGKGLFMRKGRNPYGRCETDDCWLSDRKIMIPLDDPHQVEQFARRPIEERQAAEIDRLRRAGSLILPYLEWTISSESPGHHPTLPSAVAEFRQTLKETSHD